MGSSLAIESLANLVPDRPKVNPPPITQIDAVLINVRTLYRNMVGSIKAQDKELLLPRDIADFLAEEMRQCASAIGKISQSKVETYFYLCKYENLKKEFPDATLIEPTTVKQKMAKDMEDATLALIKANPEKYGNPKLFDYYVTADGLRNDRVAMLTHLPLDLINKHAFREIYLLESNTGAFKSYREFSSKFKVKPNGAYFPFNLFTLQVFGDGKLFNSMHHEVVEFVIGLSKANRWTYMTTREKIMYNLSNAGESKFSGFLKRLLRT